MRAAGVVRIDQHMAASAGEMLPPVVNERLRTRYRQLPIMVRSAGLAATYAFLVGKSDKGEKPDKDELGTAYRAVADGIRKHLTKSRGLEGGIRTNEEMLTELAKMRPADYARAAVEVQTLAVWLARLGEARFRATQT